MTENNNNQSRIKGLSGEITDAGDKGFMDDEVLIENTFAEGFDAYVASILITATNRNLAEIAAISATGYATSVIGCGTDAGIAYHVPPQEVPGWETGFRLAENRIFKTITLFEKECKR